MREKDAFDSIQSQIFAATNWTLIEVYRPFPPMTDPTKRAFRLNPGLTRELAAEGDGYVRHAEQLFQIEVHFKWDSFVSRWSVRDVIVSVMSSIIRGMAGFTDGSGFYAVDAFALYTIDPPHDTDKHGIVIFNCGYLFRYT